MRLLFLFSLTALTAVADTPARFNSLFRNGFAVTGDFKLRDAAFSRAGSLDIAGFNAHTAVTAAVAAEGRLLIGTSNRGVFASTDGKSWRHEPVMAVPRPPPSLTPSEVQEYIVPSTRLCFVSQVYSEQEAITAFMSPCHGP